MIFDLLVFPLMHNQKVLVSKNVCCILENLIQNPTWDNNAQRPGKCIFLPLGRYSFRSGKSPQTNSGPYTDS